MKTLINQEVNQKSLLESEIKTTRPLSKEQIATYHQDGYVIIRGMFDPEEIEPLQKACQEDPSLNGSQIKIEDGLGQGYKASVWTELGDALLGVMPRMARIVDAVEVLLGEECYHWHSKIVRKQPSEGLVPWHQGFGSWYEDGCLYPNIVSCSIAIDKNSIENGCLQVIRGSHLMGRIDNVSIGNTCGTDPVRLEKIMERLEVVYCEMEPGDVLLFHANTLHGSDPNTSDQYRTLMHCSYNAVSNEPIFIEGQEHHRYRPLHKLPDSILKEGKYTSVFSANKFHQLEKEGDTGGIFIRHGQSPSPGQKKKCNG
jgi:hypothetical protein